MKRPRAWFLAAALGAALGCDGSVSSGDRVLVDKSAYETRLHEPQRFDVVVFKFPERPFKNNTPTNYIKRLLGLPGEIIAIFFGRLFHFPPPGGIPPFKDHEDPNIDPKNLLARERIAPDDPEAHKLFDDGTFKIIRKPPDVMMALRRIVYDNDFQAKDMAAFPRWSPAKGSEWTTDKAHGFANRGANADTIDWMHYRHLVRPKNGVLAGNQALKPQLITDFMGYNSFVAGRDNTPEPNWVGDLMLECNVEATKGEGELVLELSKGIHRFQARWDLGSGVCTLFKNEIRYVDEGGKKVAKLINQVELDSKPTKLRGPGSYQVRFANIDARLTVWVDRELPFGDGKDYPPPEVRSGADEKDLDEITLQQRRGPTENDLEPASIGSKGAALQVRHVRLWRDSYYSLRAGQSDVRFQVDLADPDAWRDFKTMEYKTLYVQPGHYLCLGDNSQASSDGREWGLVPDRLMLGRALLVYYPFHRAGPIR